MRRGEEKKGENPQTILLSENSVGAAKNIIMSFLWLNYNRPGPGVCPELEFLHLLHVIANNVNK